jgi:hypothetical protein
MFNLSNSKFGYMTPSVKLALPIRLLFSRACYRFFPSSSRVHSTTNALYVETQTTKRKKANWVVTSCVGTAF